MPRIDDSLNDFPSSPARSIKRAPIVYGKRSNNHHPPSAQQFTESIRVHTESLPPCSSSPPLHNQPSDSEDADTMFQFGFRHRLKELDEQFDNHDVLSSRPGPSPSRKVACAEPSQVDDLQSVAMDTAFLSSEVRRSSGDDSRASLSPLSSSLCAASAEDPPTGPSPVYKRMRKVRKPVHFDSEAEESGNSSSVSPVRHLITTPHSRSSPTPPTSGEVPMMSRKAKGKAAARDLLPLVFDGEKPLPSELPTKSKKGKRGESSARPKTRAPTKKERREAAFESSRIAADRPVEVMRTQEQKHSLTAFFAGLRRDQIITSTPGTELPSDPIERFSSPTDNSTRVPLHGGFGVPTELLCGSVRIETSTRKQSSPEHTEMHPPAANESDDEMLSVACIIQQEDGKQQRLREIKQAVLQRGDTNNNFCIDSEDDDLLIVKDDMHTVAREEAAQRKLDKVNGSPIKDRATLRRINHPSIRPPMSPPCFSKHELQELAKPSFVRVGKGIKNRLTKKQLDQLMITQHKIEQLKSIKRQEEDWVKGGGKLLRDSADKDAQTSLSRKLEAYAEQGLKSVAIGKVVEDEASADESDEEYRPDLRGSASPQLMDVDEDQGLPNDKDVSHVLQGPEDNDDEEGEEIVAPLRRNKAGQRYLRVVVGSDDEEEHLSQRNPAVVQRNSVSSMESQTEDENDKENSRKLMYDRSEDKENRAIVRYEPSSSELTFGSRPASQRSVEGDIQRTLTHTSTTDFGDTTGSPKGNARSPLKDISKGEDDPFLSPLLSKSPFTERHLSPPRTSTSTLSLGSPPVLRSERISRINRPSLDSEYAENSLSGFKPLQPSFLERLHSQVTPEPSFAPINPNGGLSQLFSAEDLCSNKPLGDLAGNEGLSLTLDVGLKPALEVSGTLRQRAEAIFEKEQEYVASAVQQNNRAKELLYVNDHGFLTQTRPEGSSPQAYRMTPSQASKFIGTQVHSEQTPALSARPPLRTLSFAASQELSPEPQPLRRLRKRSPSPHEQNAYTQNSGPVAKLDAFSILGKVPKPSSKAQQEKHLRSEFVAIEAEESDEDDMFGFGGLKKNEDEEEDDNEQDKVVEGLVDDTVMDAETVAAHLVQEKYREHEEEDDQRLQKVHQDAIEGKFRMKRRGRGLAGFEDESDEDEDEDARRIRQRIYKKRKVEGDTLEALGQNEETRAFYNTYHQDLLDKDDEFGRSRDDITIPADNDDTQTEELEERETVSMDEIRQHVRDMAQNGYEVETLNPEDTDWIDRTMVDDTDDVVHVKVMEHRRGRSTARNPVVGQANFDNERTKRYRESEQERKQMMSWAKNQSRRHQGTARSGTTTAVTGHTKARGGGGSLRSRQLPRPETANAALKTIQKTSSMLSTVASRQGKFA